MRRISRIAAPVLALGLILAACGDDSSSSTQDTTAAEEAATADTTATAQEETLDVASLGLIEDGKLTVCTDAPYPPFEFQDETTKEWTGFDMDVVREIAGGIGSGLELAVTVQPFDGIWLAPKAGTCDMVASAMTITDERKANALFTDGYFDADQSLLVRTQDKDALTSLEALAGKTIAVQTGTTGETYAQENAKDSTLKSFDEAAAMFLALESGDVDAILQDLPVNAERALMDDKTALTASFPTGEQYGFAVSQDNTALADALNAGIAEIKANGTYDEIYAKYFAK
ncbi:MAG: basic amino acid ABC transporter substrate-binding protein [Actinobacteria bacterium]|nr:basic amino acid ABC transporter substrate-binding protein [Actinomycetota bacterium]